MYQILTTSPTTGCIVLVSETNEGLQGHGFIEAGDFDRARELLSQKDYEMVVGFWTPELLQRRERQLSEMAL